MNASIVRRDPDVADKINFWNRVVPEVSDRFRSIVAAVVSRPEVTNSSEVLSAGPTPFLLALVGFETMLLVFGLLLLFRLHRRCRLLLQLSNDGGLDDEKKQPTPIVAQ